MREGEVSVSGDLAIALRQGIWIVHILPIAIERLEKDVWAGDLYDGELLAALRFVPRDSWTQNEHFRSRAAHLIKEAEKAGSNDEEFSEKLKLLNELLSSPEDA
jgi:hypothetical protein